MSDQLSLDSEFAAANERALKLNEGKDQTQSALTVSEAMQIAKGALEGIRLRIIGEVSKFTGNRYATKYFGLKDEDAVINCVMWAGVYQAAGVELKDGLEIEVAGKFSAYAAKGQLNFHVSKISVAGEGALRIELAQREARLRAEGLFDPARKKPLPAFPEKIAVVTSPAGAVIHDIIRTLGRRWPLAEILVYGVRVEGLQAPSQIIEGLRAADAGEGELILLARGGGSFEDLLVFSDEALVRAAAALNKPLITGIGHEPDNSLADLVADYRASTPTAAAEAISSPDIEELQARVSGDGQALSSALRRSVALLHARLDGIRSRAVFKTAEAVLFPYTQRIDHTMQILDALSPLKVLGRGYSMVFDELSGGVIDRAAKAHAGQAIQVRVRDGSLDCEVKGVRGE